MTIRIMHEAWIKYLQFNRGKNGLDTETAREFTKQLVLFFKEKGRVECIPHPKLSAGLHNWISSVASMILLLLIWVMTMTMNSAHKFQVFAIVVGVYFIWYIGYGWKGESHFLIQLHSIVSIEPSADAPIQTFLLLPFRNYTHQILFEFYDLWNKYTHNGNNQRP